MLKSTKKWMATAACAGLAAAATTAYSPAAEACGGLFCNQSQPVNQSAERIIFSKNDDNTVTAVVQIMYEGPSERFAWVLPVPGAPEVGVSSNLALTRLQQATNPIYRLNVTVEGECDSDFRGGGFGSADSATAADGGDPEASPAGGVDVVDSGSVGPYDYTTISVRPGSTNPEQEALEWLDTNGYDIGALAPDLIRDYLEDGMNLLAVKLQKSTDAGDIRPIRLTYDSELPMIPIKLTAVAANDDMGVLVWVLGEDRAIPSNYKALELNEAAINWLNPTSNYNDVVSQAADEAQGQGFVTEFAGAVGDPIQTQFQRWDLTQVIYTSSEATQWEQLRGTDWSDNEGDLLVRTARYASWDGFQKVVSEHVPLPDGVTAEQFAQCIGCYDLIRQRDIPGFDAPTFLDQLDQFVIEPMSQTQELVSSLPYITRMYTTMSAAEMTLDPVFDFNRSLGDVSNEHVAEQIIECTSDYTQSEAPWRIELPQGDTVFGVGQQWPLGAEDDMPATRVIVQPQPMGVGQVVTDNSAQIGDAIAENNRRVTDEVSGGLACSAGDTSAVDLSLLALLVGGVGVAAARRRRD